MVWKSAATEVSCQRVRTSVLLLHFRGGVPYNAGVRALIIGTLCLTLCGCPAAHDDVEDRSGRREQPATRDEARVEPVGRAKVDREESLRRTEAVRRAVEELSTRGVKTDGYLMNLITGEGTYKISFVKQSGRHLKSEIAVTLRSEDFEILSIEGAGVPDGAARSETP